MNRHELFIKRLKEEELYDDDSDYNGKIGRDIEELSKVFSEQGHSGMSASVMVFVWNQLFIEYNDPFSKMWKGEKLEVPE